MTQPLLSIPEIWKPIKGLEGYCEISNKKRVRLLKYGTRYGVREHKEPKIPIPFIGGTGYYTVCLGVSNIHKRRFYRIHKLWADVFLPNPNNYPFLNHIDGDKLNNDDYNLEWCTPKHNMQHAFRTGLIVFKSGENHHRSKLTAEQVLEIAKKDESCNVLSKKFNIHKTIICDIWNGVIWNSITGLPKANPKLKILK